MSKMLFIKGTLLLTFTGLLSRLLGFFYRIFLSHTIGAHGLGLFQLVLPLQLLVMAVCASGIQSAISRLTATSLLSVQFSISLPYFEIVTKFLQLLCVFMILLFLNNVNIFVAYFFFYRENLIFSTKAAEEKIPSTSDTILPAVLELYNPTLSDVIL